MYHLVIFGAVAVALIRKNLPLVSFVGTVVAIGIVVMLSQL